MTGGWGQDDDPYTGRSDGPVEEPRPYRCPVCNGEGRRMPAYPLPVLDPLVTCHACKGTGLLWAEAAHPATEGLDVDLKRIADEGWERSRKPGDDAAVLAEMAETALARLSSPKGQK